MKVNKTKHSTRLLSFVLAAAMLCGMLPMSAFAQDNTGAATTNSTVTSFGQIGQPFEQIADGVYAQKVTLGTSAEELQLPETLEVTVEVVDFTKSESTEPDNGVVTPNLTTPELPVAPVDGEDNTQDVVVPQKGQETTEENIAQDQEEVEVLDVETPLSDAPEIVMVTRSETISVNWVSEKAYSADAAGEFAFFPVLPEGYAVLEGVAVPSIHIVVGDTECTCVESCGANTVTDCTSCTENFENCEIASITVMPEAVRYISKFGAPKRKGRSSGVVTDYADFDVFVSTDPNHRPDADAMAKKISGYLDTLIAGGVTAGDTNKTSRFQTSTVTIDPTDLTKWYLFDHYDSNGENPEFTDKATWTTWVEQQAKNNGTDIPKNWYYYGLADGAGHKGGETGSTSKPNNNKKETKTIPQIFGTDGWGCTAYLREHIATAIKDGMPAMDFYGYYTSNFADFLFYPAASDSTKYVEFDVNASDVRPHSLKYAGFLFNTGVYEKNGKMLLDGYAMLFRYAGDASITGVTGAYIFKLSEVDVDKLHAEGLKGISSTNANIIQTSSFTQSSGNLWKQSRISMEITPTSLNATITKLDESGNVVSGAENQKILFDIKTESNSITNTNYGGFGPYVDYGVSNHTCLQTSAYRYLNLKMSFKGTQAIGGSVLDGLKHADYLDDSAQRYFINLTDPSTKAADSKSSYASEAVEADMGYLNTMQNDKVILLTDETLSKADGGTTGDPIFPHKYLPGNVKDANDSNDLLYQVDGVDKDGQDEIDVLLNGNTDKTEKLAATLAWLIYHYNTWDTTNNGAEAKPTSTAFPQIKLMSEAGKQVNEIQKELVSKDTENKQMVKVYLDNTGTLNGKDEKAIYKITLPDGKGTKTITDAIDSDTNVQLYKEDGTNKLYILVDVSNKEVWPTGTYNVSLTYDVSSPYEVVTDGVTHTILLSDTAITKLNVTTDTTAPTVTKPTTKASATGNFDVEIEVVNTPGTAANTYVSDLKEYAVVVNISNTLTEVQANDIAPEERKPASDLTPANGKYTGTYTDTSVSVPNEYYVHVIVWDAAGNVGIEASDKYSPIRVNITATKYDKDSGITVVPSHNKAPNAIEEATLEYRQVGTDNWIAIPDWKGDWKTDGYIIPFTGLTPGASYEVKITASDKQLTTDSASLTFIAPKAGSDNGAGTGNGTITGDIEKVPQDETVIITLKKGDEIVASKKEEGTQSPTEDINFSFDNLPDGKYNVVISDLDGNTRTQEVEIKNGTVIFPTGSDYPIKVDYAVLAEKKTIVKFNPGSPVTPPAVVVDQLNEQYENIAAGIDDNKGVTQTDMNSIAVKPDGSGGGSALIELVVTGVIDNASSPFKDDIQSIKTESNQNISQLVDLTLFKTITPTGSLGTTTQLIESNSLLKVSVPMKSVSGSNINVYRVHEDGTKTTDKLSKDPADDTVNGEYYEIKDGYLILHVKKFSLYAITYTPYSYSDDDTTPSNPTYPVKPEKDPDGGDITTDKGNSKPGDDVTITVKPDDGYVLEDLIVKDKDGNKIPIKDKGNGEYTFTMPDSAVTITPTFREELASLDKTGVGKLLNAADHILYLRGDDLGTFRPLANMTRAEVAQMFYNLLLNQKIETTATFSDVNPDAWYADAVNVLAAMGIIEGYNGMYRPMDAITRAEFTQIAVRFANAQTGNVRFTDVAESHWAYKAIGTAAYYGWIKGSDGAFAPDRTISRAEVATIVNRMLVRIADKAYIQTNLNDLKIFPDAADQNYWAWLDIVESTNGHDFKVDSQEVWTNLK